MSLATPVRDPGPAKPILSVRDLVIEVPALGGATRLVDGVSFDVMPNEVMGIVGNFQLGPDLYRDRGYSGFAEYSFNNAVNVGVSSLITYAGADLTSLLPTVRHAHGAFGRFVPAEKFAILAEADFLMWQVSGQADRLGFAAFVQGDWEPVQGLHVMVTGESSHTGSGERGANYGGWLSAAWYFFGHCELRLDNVFRRKAVSGGAGQFEYNLLLQLHAYL